MVLGEHNALVRGSCARFDGFEASNHGDGFLYLFPSALAAANAAIDARNAIETAPWPEDARVRIRIGIHSGAVTYSVNAGFVGLDIHRASRLSSSGVGGQILVSAATTQCLRLASTEWEGRVDGLGFFWLKDIRLAEEIYELDRVGVARRVRARPIGGADFPPTPCRLIGRERELEALESAVGQATGVPVTVTGFGGVGKTRLSTELLLRCSTRPGYFVDLAHLDAAASVTAAIANALGLETSTVTVSAIDGIALEIERQQALLVLDNFEQILGASHDVARLARNAPTARVVVTSRSRLRVAGEIVIELLPLDTTSDSGPAVELFEVLAGQRTTTLLDPDDRRIVAELCRLVDGVPLAIELAAGRLELLGLSGLQTHLNESMSSLGAGRRDSADRHSAIDNAIRWSYELLPATAQRTFLCLSQFAGGATPKAITEVLGTDASSAIVDLGDLVDQYLARRVTPDSGEPRFAMIRMVREFGSAELQRVGSRLDLRERIAGYYRRFAHHTATNLQSKAQFDAYRRTQDELENIRSVLAWSLDDRLFLDEAFGVATDLTAFWWQGNLAEGLDWLRRLSELAGSSGHRTAARLYVRGALLATYCGQADEAIELAMAGIKICEREGRGNADRSMGLQTLAAALSARRDVSGALEAVYEWLDIDRTVNKDSRAIHIVNHANVLLAENLVDDAAALYEESVSIFGAKSETWLVAGPIARLGDVATRRGDYELATRLLRDAIATWQAGGGTSGLARSQGGLARARFLLGDRDEALRLAGDAFQWAFGTRTIGEAHWSVIVRAAALVDEGRCHDAAATFGNALRLAYAFAQPIHACIEIEFADALAEIDRQIGVEERLRVWGRSQRYTVHESLTQVQANWATVNFA